MFVAEDIIEPKVIKALNLEPEKSAEVAGLRYVTADTLIIERKKSVVALAISMNRESASAMRLN